MQIETSVSPIMVVAVVVRDAVTQLAAILVPATLAIREMVSHAQVCIRAVFFSACINSCSDLDVNECVSGHGCDTNAECTNSVGTYSCTCNTGYAGNGFYCNGR